MQRQACFVYASFIKIFFKIPYRKLNYHINDRYHNSQNAAFMHIELQIAFFKVIKCEKYLSSQPQLFSYQVLLGPCVYMFLVSQICRILGYVTKGFLWEVQPVLHRRVSRSVYVFQKTNFLLSS